MDLQITAFLSIVIDQLGTIFNSQAFIDNLKANAEIRDMWQCSKLKWYEIETDISKPNTFKKALLFLICKTIYDVKSVANTILLEWHN